MGLDDDGLKSKDEGKFDSKVDGHDDALGEFPPEYYQYELRGITIHSGTATGGHYFSYIRDRDVDDIEDGENEGWFEFNDTRVTPFDPRTIEQCCFGKKETPARFDKRTAHESAEQMFQDQMGGSNAFMLWYDRVGPKMTLYRSLDEPEVPFTGSPEIYQLIKKENVTFWKRRFISDRNYFSFLKDFVSRRDPPVVRLTYPNDAELKDITSDDVTSNDMNILYVQLGFRFMLGTLAGSPSSKSELPIWIKMISNILSMDTHSSIWLLSFVMKHKRILSQVIG